MSELEAVTHPDRVTPEWLDSALQRAGRGGGGRVTAIRRRTPVGTGQMAQNHRFELEWEGEAVAVPASVVGKFASDDPTSRATGVNQGAYRKEVEFYRQVAPLVGIRTPETYFAWIADAGDEFVLLMEDLAHSRQGDQIAGCSVDEAALALEEAARLHAPRWGDPALAKLDFLMDFGSPDAAAGLQTIYQAVWPGFAERYAARVDPEILELSRRFGPRIAAWAGSLPTPRTVTHGDYRPDNLLFADAPGAPPLVTVDWQTVARGAGASDVAYLLGAGLPVEVRRREEARLVRLWWDALRAGGVEGFDAEAAWRDYRVSAFGGLWMAVLASQVVVQTERGDDMFVAMAQRHGRHALDLESEALLG